MIHKVHKSIGAANGRWRGLKRTIRVRLEGVERPRFRWFGPPEEAIVEELKQLSPAELEDRSIRELEVLARHEIGDWWDMDPSDKAPMKILTNDRHPGARGAEHLIVIPDAEPELVLLQWYEAMIDFLQSDGYRDPLDANPDTPMIHDVYHEMGHIMAHPGEDEEISYTTLEEKVYEEALANVAALEKLDGLTEFQSERIERLECLLEESPEAHIDDVLDNRDRYLEVCDYAADRLAEIDPDAPPRTLKWELTYYYGDVKDEQLEHGVDGTSILTPSVKDAFAQDIFLFLVPINNASIRAIPTDNQYKTELTMVGSKAESEVITTGDREPFGLTATGIATVDNYLPFGLERRLLDKNSIDYQVVMTPENMVRDVQRYIDRARRGVQTVDRDALKRFRAHLINDYMERWELAGHLLGVDVGYQLYLDESRDAGEFARLPQEEGIRQLRPLIEERQAQYGLSLPLETEIDYYDWEAPFERRENILDIIGV